MALLPIIYLSIAITTGLIITVVVISYISSKLRNRGTEDRILAIAYSGGQNSNTKSKSQIVVLQKQPLQRATIQKREEQPVVGKKFTKNSPPAERTTYLRESTFDRARTTRVIPAGPHISSEEINQTNRPDSFRLTSTDNRTSSQKIVGRIEIVKPNVTVGEKIPTSGHVRREMNNNDPLYYYANNSDQDFYTVTAH
ncbi:MAG: hypothetical protein KKA84_09790 [Bacteroidetes bacterium]|nr:hypothetical protein [Bacteroidota bacterium]